MPIPALGAATAIRREGAPTRAFTATLFGLLRIAFGLPDRAKTSKHSPSIANFNRDSDMARNEKSAFEAPLHKSEPDDACEHRNVDRVENELRAIRMAVSELEQRLKSNKCPAKDPAFDDYAWFQSWTQYPRI
ncbi:MAG: hypothetical protein R3C59_09825 [Planctomycetaceae bacterium]